MKPHSFEVNSPFRSATDLLRLAFVSHSLPPLDRPLSNTGGMQRVAEELLAELSSRSDLTLHQIVLRSTWRTVHLRALPFLVRSYFELRRLIVTDRIDAILFSSMVTALLTIPLSRLEKRGSVRILAIVHGLDITTPSRFYQSLVQRVFRKIDLVLPVSRATAQACAQRGLPDSRIEVIHNGVDVRRFSEGGEPLGRRPERMAPLRPESDDLPEDAFLLCSVGRLVKRKGFAWFIREVMPLLPANVHYWIAGEGPDEKAVHDAITAAGMTERVRAWGKVSEQQLHALYRGSDLFLMPNVRVPGDMEGFGIVMLEAGMNGLPTVAAGIEGILEVIRDGENGTLVDSQNAQGFADAVLRYRDDPEYHTAARARARAYTSRTFGWSHRADQYLAACARTSDSTS